MPWTTPRTWTTGEAVTSAMFNTYVRDLFKFMADEPHEFWGERSTDTTISHVTETDISWNQTTRNVGGMFTSGANVTIQNAGVYAIMVTSRWAASGGSGYAGAGIKINGTQLAFSADAAYSSVANTRCHSAHYTLRLAASDVVKGFVFQNSGGNLTLNGGVTPGTNIKVVEVQRNFS